jgi:hypothetical protein
LSSLSRLRSAVIWALALAVPGLATFACVGSLGVTVVFAPAAQPAATAGIALVGVTATTFALVGGLISVRTRHNAVGGLLLGIGGCLAVTLACMTAVRLGLPGGQWMEWATNWVSALPFALIAYLLLLFPDGHLLSHRWRPALWLAHITVVAVVLGGFATPYVANDVYAYDNPLLVRTLAGSVLDNSLLAFILIPCILVLSATSFIVRYRGARDVERIQLKWFAFAASVVVLGYLFQNAAWLLTGALGVSLAGLGFVVLTLSFNAVPIASGFAILRYRLYDVDRLVSRSVAYVLVTSVVLAVYSVVIALTATFLSADSDLVVAAATLVAASVLEPTRRQIQTHVDRRFNRAHYDAMNTLNEFGTRLTHEVDPTTVRGDLLVTVALTLQPRSVAVWTGQPVGAKSTSAAVATLPLRPGAAAQPQ